METNGRLIRVFPQCELGAIVIKAHSTVIQCATSHFIRMQGYDPEEVIERSVLDLFTEGDKDRVGTAVRLTEVHRQALEAMILRKDRTSYRVFLAIDAVSNKDGGILYHIMSIHDAEGLDQALAETSPGSVPSCMDSRLEDLFENAPVGIHWAAQDGTILRANRAELTLLGYSAEKYVGRRLAEFLVDPAQSNVIYERLSGRETLKDYPARLRTSTGAIKEVLLDMNVCWDDGRFVHTRSFIRDVTAEKGLQEARQLEQALREAVLEGMTEVVFAKDIQGRFILVNGAMTRMLGKGRADLLGRTNVELLPAGVAARLRENDLRVLRSGKPETFEELVPALGEERIFQTTRAPLRGSRGEVCGVLGIARDVTDRHRFEESQRFLIEASELLGSSLDYGTTLAHLTRLAVPRIADWCGIHIRERDGTVRRLAVAHVDPRKLRLLEELFDRYPPGPETMFEYLKVLRTGESEMASDVSQDRVRAAARSEEHLALLNALDMKSHMCVPLFARGQTIGALSLAAAESGRRFRQQDLDLAMELGRRAAFAVDNARLYRDAQREVQERQKAESQVTRLNTTLERRVSEQTRNLDKAIQELRSFAYTVAHDLRAPLRAVTAFCDILQEDYGGKVLDSSGKDMLKGIREAAQRMDVLIQGLLSYYELASAEIAIGPVDLSRVVQRALTLLEQEATARLHRIEVLQPLPSVMASEKTLADSLAKILSNAVKFVAPGTEPHVRVWAETRGSKVRLWVEDNGIGIPPEYHQRIFGVFERLNRIEAFPGTGIGLAIVGKAVDRMGGSVGVESKPGEGSRFWIELPASVPPS